MYMYLRLVSGRGRRTHRSHDFALNTLPLRYSSCTSACTHVSPFSLVFISRAEYAFGLLGDNVEKLYFSVLKNGFGLLAGIYGVGIGFVFPFYCSYNKKHCCLKKKKKKVVSFVVESLLVFVEINGEVKKK